MRITTKGKNQVITYAVERLARAHGWSNIPFEQVRSGAFDVAIVDIGHFFEHDVKSLSRAGVVVVVGPPSRKPALIEALTLGARDFLLTPLDPEELCARLEVISRNLHSVTSRNSQNRALRVFDYGLVPDRSGLEMPTGALMSLSQIEFGLFYELAAAPERIHSRAKLLDAVYGVGTSVSDRTVDYHICNIRRKLEENAVHLKISNRRGLGYMLEKRPNGG